MVDSPDSDLVNVSVPASSGVVTVVDGTAPALEWSISTIPANSSVTITYTAQLSGSALLDDGSRGGMLIASLTGYRAMPSLFAVLGLAAYWALAVRLLRRPEPHPLYQEARG